MKFTPRPYQPLMRDHVFEHPRSLIFAGMGFGKTSGMLYTLDVLKCVDDNRTLVLAPLSVAANVWPAEVKKWDNFRHLSISSIVGTPDERRKALKQDTDIHTINYENLPWLMQELGKVKAWRWGNLIADESTRLKSFRTKQGGERAKALKKAAWVAERFIGLTGTPSPNGLQDLWGQMWFIDAGKRLGDSYSAFFSRWFKHATPDPYSTVIPFPHTQVEIQDRIKDVCLSLRTQDWFDIKEPIIVDILVYLPPDARARYREMEKELFTQIEGHKIEAMSMATKSMKCLQIANGAVYTNEDCTEWSVVHNAKLDALESVIEEASGMPVLVGYHFKSDLARLMKRFPKGKKFDGSNAVTSQWNKGKIPVMFINPAGECHGHNLQDGGNIFVNFAHNWNLEHQQQVIERIGPVRQLQAGYDRGVYIYNIIAADTIDEIVVERCKTKRSVQDLLLEAAAKRRR